MLQAPSIYLLQHPINPHTILVGYRPSFNDALLAKIGWRIIKNPNCLLARCLLGKYCHSEMLMNCQASSASSHGWRSVLVGRDLLKQQLGWMVGSGESISVWNNPWLSNSEQMRPYGPAPEALQLLKVSDLIQQDTYEWDTGKIDQLIPFHKEKILKIKPSILRGDDSLVWLKNSTGEYSTRSGYLTITQEKAANLPQDPTTLTDWLPSVSLHQMQRSRNRQPPSVPMPLHNHQQGSDRDRSSQTLRGTPPRELHDSVGSLMIAYLHPNMQRQRPQSHRL